MYTIAKTFGFSASHQLDYLPEGHKCKRLHGHNYKVTLVLRAEQLDENHFVRDFGHLDRFREWLMASIAAYDYRAGWMTIREDFLRATLEPKS